MPLVESFKALSVTEGPKERPRFEPTALQLLQTLSQSIVKIKSNSIKIFAEDLKTHQHNHELEEFTLVNRDLYLWCDALEESLLLIDVFTCTQQDFASPPQHTLLERWTLKGNPLASSPTTSPHITAEDAPFAADSPNNSHNHHMPPPSPHEEGNEAKLAEFGKYLSSLMGPSTEPNLDVNEPETSGEAEDTPTKHNSSHALAELHSFVRTMPLQKWMRHTMQSVHQVYGSTRSGSIPLAFSGLTETYEFPLFRTRCSSFNLSVTFTRELDPDLFRTGGKISLITAPSRSWSTASCHIKQSHPTIPLPLSSSSFSNHSDDQPPSFPPASTPPRSIGFHLPPNSVSPSKSTSIPLTTLGFYPPTPPPSSSPSSAAVTIRSPTKLPIGPSPTSSLSASLRSPTRIINATPVFIPTTPPSQSYFPSTTSPTSSHFSSSISSTPPRSTAIRIPGTASSSGYNERTSPSSSPSPSPSSSPFHPSSSPSPNARRALFRSPSRGHHYPPPFLPGQSPPASPATVDLIGVLGGSFQESILLGHMSSTSSTSFPGFVADLGVSGKDYIPPHKRIQFAAVYYHVDPDTPYVGTVELGEKGYRVPQKGLIQLTVFNPTNTPVKTFLVNFDLTGMSPDTKTFLRQKIVTNDPPILRYAIHLRFVCPKKKRFYLYNNIRVVFPHRVPDEMEKLKVVYDSPSDPKFFPWTDSVENIHH